MLVPQENLMDMVLMPGVQAVHSCNQADNQQDVIKLSQDNNSQQMTGLQHTCPVQTAENRYLWDTAQLSHMMPPPDDPSLSISRDRCPLEPVQLEPCRVTTDVPTSIPGVMFSSLNRPALPGTMMANTTATHASLASMSNLVQTTAVSDDHSSSHRESTEFSLPSFQIPQVSEKDIPSKQDSEQDVIQLHVEVDELEDGEVTVIQKEDSSSHTITEGEP